MELTFNCPHCGAQLAATEADSGHELPCPLCKQTVAVPALRLGPGMEFGNYDVLKKLGSGAMGEVFLARQKTMDRLVALKVLAEGQSHGNEWVERFLNEARICAQLDHPNIVAAYDAGQCRGLYFLAMSFVEGETLQQRLAREHQLAEREVLQYAGKLADALAYAWEEKHVLHRDLKPSNIMIDRRGEVKLMDMGIAKCLDQSQHLTMTGELLGTPYYVSPEQARGETDLDCRADIFSLGATLYHLLTGKPPFDAPTFYGMIGKMLTESEIPAATLNPQLTPAVSALLQRMMAKSRDDRPADWRALKTEVEQVLAGQTGTVGDESPVAGTPRSAVPPPQRTPPAQPPTGRWGVRLGVAAAVLMCVVLGGWVGARYLQAQRVAGACQRARAALGQGQPAAAIKTLDGVLAGLTKGSSLRRQPEAVRADAQAVAAAQNAIAKAAEQCDAREYAAAETTLTAPLAAVPAPYQSLVNAAAADVRTRIAIGQLDVAVRKLLVTGLVARAREQYDQGLARLPAASRNDALLTALARDLERAAEQEKLRQRCLQFFTALFSGRAADAQKLVDPRDVARLGAEPLGQWLQHVGERGETRQLTAEQLRTGLVVLAPDLNTASVGLQVQVAQGWRDVRTTAWARVAGEWYLHPERTGEARALSDEDAVRARHAELLRVLGAADWASCLKLVEPAQVAKEGEANIGTMLKVYLRMVAEALRLRNQKVADIEVTEVLVHPGGEHAVVRQRVKAGTEYQDLRPTHWLQTGGQWYLRVELPERPPDRTGDRPGGLLPRLRDRRGE